MDINAYHELSSIQLKVLEFVDKNDNLDEDFDQLILFLEKIQNNKYEIQILLYLVSKISKNHYRSQFFFYKIEKIISYFKKEIKQLFSNEELFKIFKKSKRILLFLFEKGIIIMDKCIYEYLNNKDFLSNYASYFINEIKKFKNEEINQDNQENFEQKRKTGENDSYLCSLIRNDSIEEFIIYVNQNNVSLSSKITKSIFETNNFLLKNNATLIEYAAFFGSIQIFNYLHLNNVKFESSLWFAAIHGRNYELIQLLENNNIKPSFDSYRSLLDESIRCHHNEIANYIKENYLENADMGENMLSICLKYYNFELIQKSFLNETTFFYLCEYNYYLYVNLFLKTTNIDINKMIINH